MPSDRAIRNALEDILEHIELAESFAADIDEDGFQLDLQRIYAVTRCLEIISEASRRLPEEMKARHKSIAWREMAAAGNLYRHEYQHVTPRRIWQTLKIALPPLREIVEGELKTFG